MAIAATLSRSFSFFCPFWDALLLKRSRCQKKKKKEGQKKKKKARKFAPVSGPGFSFCSDVFGTDLGKM